MAYVTQTVRQDGPEGEKKSFANGYLFGAPVKDLGILATVIMGFATGMAAFFLATFVGIASILFYNAAGHKADYTNAYKFVGLPFGLAVLAFALAYLGTFWVKRVFRKA